MSLLSRPTRIRSVSSLVALLLVSSLFVLPSTVRADTNLDVGGEAIIAYANGDDVRLRDAPGFDQDVITLLAEGTTLNVLGGPSEADDGSMWYRVTDGNTTGYMVSDYLARADSNGGSGETTTTTSDVNLREGPSTADDVISVLDPDVTVTITGNVRNGFYPVTYQGTSGWVYGGYLAVDGGSDTPAVGEAVVDSELSLRAGPSTSDDILEVMPGGATVEILGDPENGFYPVRYNGQSGWASGDYLNVDGEKPAGNFAIVWPVSGGEWQITQGYHGSSHYNGSSTYQYDNSFDIVSTDGNTAYQPVYAPVNGTIRWTEQASGGISIDMGNGYAIGLFHITVDPSLSWGDSLTQGQEIGYISGPGGDGNMGFDHVHFTVWATTDGGNWSRTAVPFSGQNAIAGVDYSDSGASMQWTGTVFYP